MKINEVDPRNYDSDIDYYDALRRSGRRQERDPDDYVAPEVQDDEDAISQQRQAAAARARRERETTWDNKEEGAAPNGQKYNSVYTIAAPNKASADSEAYSFKDYHWGAKKVVDQAYRDLGDGRVELKLYVVDNHKYGLWRPWKDSPVYKEGVAEGDVTHTSTGLIHRAKDKYGAGEDEDQNRGIGAGFSAPGKSAKDLERLNKQLVRDLESGMDVHWKKRGKKIDVEEGGFGIDSRTKGAIQNVVSQLSDIPGMWDHKGQTFTPQGLEKLKSLLKNNEQHIEYAVNLTADDFDESIKEAPGDGGILDRIRDQNSQNGSNPADLYSSLKDEWAKEKEDKERANSEKQDRTDQMVQLVQDVLTTGDFTEWNKLRPQDKFDALKASGLIKTFWDEFSSSRDHDSIEKLNAVLQQAVKNAQDQTHDIALGAEGRAEVKRQAEELAEMRRQQLRAEKLEAEKIAYERYKDEQERKDAMKKIEMEYKHDLDMINTEHRNNMEAIRTGNSHEIDKIRLDHAESARDREHELNMLRQQQEHENQQAERDRPQREKPDAAAFPEPEPEEVNEPEAEEDGEPYRPQAPAGPALTAPTQPTKPDRFNNDDAIDVDFREVPDDEEEAPTPGKPPQLGAPKKESAKNPYAIGMAQAMKSKGDRPPLDKATIRKAHEIAKRIMQQD